MLKKEEKKKIINKIFLDPNKKVNNPNLTETDNSSFLLKYLSPINEDIIKEDFGKEKIFKNLEKNIILTKTTKGFFRILYLNENEEIVGRVHGLNKRNERVLLNIFVRRDYRRQGIGTKLMELLINKFKGIKHSNNFTKDGYEFFNIKEKMINHERLNNFEL